MSYASDIIDLRRCRTIASGCCTGLIGPQGPQGPQGPGVAPLYGSFISLESQDAVKVTSNPNSVAITYNLKTAGTINFSGSQIYIPVTGTYRVLFSAQCDCILGLHTLEIFPVINNISVPNSNTRIAINSGIETCLTVEYFLDFIANDILEFRMTEVETAGLGIGRLYYIPVNLTYPTNPVTIPAVPSIILTIQRIA